MKKYMDILTAVELKIAEGHYRAGQKLPSVRSAATEYGCSVSTVIRAYSELEKRHTIYSVAQSGYYVVGKEQKRDDSNDSPIIDFASVLPDVELFPYLDFQHCLNKAIDIYKHQLFAYGEPMGLLKLRQTLSSHLGGDQVFTGADRIAIVSGGHQALEILAKMPFPNGKKNVLVEQPSYDLYLRFLEREGIPVRGIARTAQGIDLKELEQQFKGADIKFFYTMPRYHNPLGTSYSPEIRKAIARLAAKYDVYVVEDDYMADLGEMQGYEPIYSYDLAFRVIYVKSFSKIIFPGLRLGAVVLPEPLISAFKQHKIISDTSLLSQAALEVYIKNGMYERHRIKISSHYAEKIAALNEAVGIYNTANRVRLSDVCSGIYVQFKLPQNVNLERLMVRLEGRGIRAVSGKGFYLTGYLEREKFLRISISRAGLSSIEEGVKAIIEETERELPLP
ncbi:PLP-dependent aminotransferase family protein [Paenibacillus sp. GCM10027627]|uniref:aminotransferase-like domain-containing protein n=1 Tax=unclassified Paenibacillus TaxID=185978 RepID=UPI003639E898